MNTVMGAWPVPTPWCISPNISIHHRLHRSGSPAQPLKLYMIAETLTSRSDGTAGFATIWWRLLFLLLSDGLMFGFFALIVLRSVISLGRIGFVLPLDQRASRLHGENLEPTEAGEGHLIDTT